MNIDHPVHEVDAAQEERYTGYKPAIKSHTGESRKAESETGRHIE